MVFSKIYSPVCKIRVAPAAALAIDFLKDSTPGFTIISSTLITGAIISGFQPGPVLNFNAFGKSVPQY